MLRTLEGQTPHVIACRNALGGTLGLLGGAIPPFATNSQ